MSVVRRDPQSPRSLTLVMLLTVVLSFLSLDRAMALHPSALEEIAKEHESRVFTLLVDLHEPAWKADSMQTPTLERRGWHHHNPTGPIALRAGSRVEVTGIFNYAERGLFLELAREAAGMGKQAITERARLRIRIMVETPGTDPQAQQAEAIEMIHKVIAEAGAP